MRDAKEMSLDAAEECLNQLRDAVIRLAEVDGRSMDEAVGQSHMAAIALLRYHIRASDAEVRRAVVEECKAAVPHNWTDPLLTGPDKVIRADADCAEITNLLNAVRQRIAALDPIEARTTPLRQKSIR